MIEHTLLHRRKHFFPFLVSILPPSVFLFYFFCQNSEYILLWHALITIGIFTIGASVLQLVVSKIVKSSCIAALINNILWVLFFTVKLPYMLLLNFFNNNILILYISIISVTTLAVIYLIVKYKNKLQKQEFFMILSIFWITILILNIVSALVRYVNINTKFAGYSCKTEFNIDTNLPSPNVYWLMMDGMIGFQAMEHLFNDPHSTFINQLTERGFIINPKAQFEALHHTTFCLPAMMCPNYYDTYFLPALQNCNLNDYKQKIKYRNLIGKTANLARSKNELITAFNKKGYQTNTIIYSLKYYLTANYNTSLIYVNEKKMNVDDFIFSANYMSLFFEKEMLYATTLLSKRSFILEILLNKYGNSKSNEVDIDNQNFQLSDVSKSFFGESYRGMDKWYLNALTDIMKSSTNPTLTIIHDQKAHFPYSTNKYGKEINQRKKNELYDPCNYPAQHYFASSIVISYIDFILNADPEAVIILQSDHGLHDEKTRSQLISKYGKKDDDVQLMQNQTISAVRIPDMETGHPIEPLNIARLLVNRYVGDNYELLDAENIIK